MPGPTSHPSRLAVAATWGRLQTFAAVVDTGSVRGAAEMLHVTPPAVSAAVSALEDELGVALLAKAGRGVTPTDAGTVFAGYCRTLIGLLHEAASAVHEAERSRLRIGAVDTAGEHVLPPLLATFARAYPDVDLHVTVGPRDDLFAALTHHEIDLVVAGRPPRGSGLVSRARRPTTLIAVAAPELAERAADDPGGVTWLLRGAGSGTRRTTQGLLERNRTSPPTLTLGTLGSVLAAAREGLGVTLAHHEAVADDLATGRLVQVDVAGTPIDRPWHLVAATGAPAAVGLFVRQATDDATATHPFVRRGASARG